MEHHPAGVPALVLLVSSLALGSVTAQAALPPTLDTAAADALLHGEAAGDYHGRQLYGGGDVNGDGYEDLLIGAYGNDAGGNAAGKAYLILGGATHLGGAVSVATAADASWIGEHAGDYASLELAICPDLDADGRDELLIGAYHSSDGGAEAGKIYVVYGRASGWTTGTSLAQADASFSGAAGTATPGTRPARSTWCSGPAGRGAPMRPSRPLRGRPSSGSTRRTGRGAPSPDPATWTETASPTC